MGTKLETNTKKQETTMSNAMRTFIEIYQDAETDEFTVRDCSGQFDDFCTFDEQEAKDEADAWADELNAKIVSS